MSKPTDVLAFADEGIDEATFNELRDDPAGWAWHAKSLMDAADTLEGAERASNMSKLIERAGSVGGEDTPIGLRTFDRPRLLLVGLAVENILKALYVSRKPALPSGKLDKLGTHNQENLAQWAGIQLSADELALLKALTKVVEWSGRYHISKTPDKTPKWQAGGSLAYASARDLFTALWGTYEGRLAPPPAKSSQ
jgi:hypothetical protein